MRPKLFLRIAAVLAGLQSIFHTIGGVFGKPDPGPASAAVLAMKTNQFQVTGLNRSYWDFFIGFGLAITVFLAMEAVVFWQLGSLAESDTERLRPILALFLIGYIALAVDAYVYFFAPPLIGDTLIAVCLAAAISTARTPATA